MNPLRSAFAAFLCFLLAACANLGAIREFGEISSDSAGYTQLTTEYATSPDRRKQYTFASENEQRSTLDGQAAERNAQVQALLLYHRAVSEYMQALAELASDKPTSFDSEIGGLADAAVKAEYIQQAEGDAIKTIASAIANAATDFYRQRKLKQVIGEANAPLQLVLSDMSTLVRGYEESLCIEQTDARSYYRRLEQMARHDDKKSVEAERVWGDGQARDTAIDHRLVAAKAYQNTLKRISEGHQSLYDNRDRISKAEVQSQIRRYAGLIQSSYKAVKDYSSSSK